MRIIAPMMILIMMTSTLAGCTGGDPDGGGNDEIDWDAINDLIDSNIQDFYNNTTLTDGTDGQDGADGQNGTNGIFSSTICELVPWGYCVNANLDSLDLSNMDLTGINLRGSSLVNTNLNGATLDFAVMRQVYALNANLQEASFNRTDLSNANLQGANMANSYFVTADLSYTYQWTTNMSGAVFHWADMTGSHLSQVIADGADFSLAKIDTVRWFGNFNSTIFVNTHLISSFLGGDFQKL